MPRRAAAVAAVTLGLLLLAAPAGAVTITEFPIEAGAPAGQHVPYFIVSGTDGTLWFTDAGPRRGIGRIGTGGSRPPTLRVDAAPYDLVAGADGAMYWTEDEDADDKGHVVRYSANGTRTSIARGGVKPWAIALASDGSTWWTEQNFNSSPPEGTYICHSTNPIAWSGATCSELFTGSTPPRATGLALAPNGTFWSTVYESARLERFNPGTNMADRLIALPAGAGAYRIARGPDGNMWAVDYKLNQIYRFTDDGVTGNLRTFPLPGGRGPNDIVAGPDGALWFTEFDGNRIGRMTTDGTLTDEFTVPTPSSTPWGITVGPDGNIWFTESSGAKIGRLVLDKPAGGGGGGPGGGGAGGGGGAVVDRFAPRFDRRLALLRARFRAGATATPVSAVRRPVTPVGSAFTFTLSEPATVAISIARRAAGRRVGRLCRAPSRANRGHARCVRYVSVGALRRRGLQGPNRVTFSGRIGARKLAPGAYRASAVAKDAAGNASPASLAAFTVVTR